MSNLGPGFSCLPLCSTLCQISWIICLQDVSKDRHLDDEELIFLLKRIDPVELDISECPYISEASFEVMATQCSRLRTLRMRESRKGSLCTVHLGKIKTLEVLDLTDWYVQQSPLTFSSLETCIEIE